MKFGTRITERGPGALRDGISTYIGSELATENG